MFCDEHNKKLCKRRVGCDGLENVVTSLGESGKKRQERSNDAGYGILFGFGEFGELGFGSRNSLCELQVQVSTERRRQGLRAAAIVMLHYNYSRSLKHTQ